MRIRLLLALIGSAIGFVAPDLAQEPNTVDPEARHQIEELIDKHADAVNKKDTAAIAALYTQYAAQIHAWESEGGLASGPQAIEKRFAAELASNPGNMSTSLSRSTRSATKYPLSRSGVGGAGSGYYARIYIRDANTWKIRVEYATLWYQPR
jgi:hypothetical protein